MTGDCPVIELFPLTLDSFLDNGHLYLDIDANTSISLSREITNKDGLFTDELQKEFKITVPSTPKNFYYLKSLFDPNTEKLSKYIECRISVGSTTLYNSKLYASNKNNNQIECIIKYEPDWIELLKGLKLKDIDLPSIDFSKQDVEDRWLEDGEYNDGDPGYFYPVCNYGGWRKQKRHNLVVEDLRPFLSPIYLMDLMFKKIGWCFESPFYETNYGRRLWSYLLKKDYNNNEDLKNDKLFIANKHFAAGYQQYLGYINNWTEIQDNGNNFDETIGIYNSPFTGSIHINRTSGSETPGAVSSYFLYIYKQNVITGEITQVYYNQQGAFLENDSFEILIENVILLPNEQLFLQFATAGNPDFFSKLKNSLDINYTISIDEVYYKKGDVIDLKKEVIQDLSCYDLLAAYQHFIFGVIDEDYSAKKVILYTPFDATIFGENITGYFNNQLNDLTSKQPQNTTKSAINEKDSARYINLGFKNSTDAYLKDKVKANGLEYFLKPIDLGDVLNKDSEDDKNPLFEGTAINTELYLFDARFYVTLPQLLDEINKDQLSNGKISYSIEPRIVFCKGVGYQNAQSGAAIMWEDFDANPYLPVCFDSPKYNLYTPNEVIVFVSQFDPDENNTAPIDEKFLYGDEVNDLWSLVYGKFYLQYKNRISLDGLVNLNHADYFGLSLKNLFQIEYDGHPVTGRLLRIQDFKPCESLDTQILLLPELTTDNYCIEPTTDDNCNNTAHIIKTQDCDCFYFSVSGNYSCNVISLDWEYKNEDTSNEWTPIPDASNTAQLCDLIINTYVRVKITFAELCDCPPIYANTFVNPCENNLKCLITQTTNNAGQICLQWSYLGSLPCGYSDLGVTIDGDDLDSPYLFCGAEPNTTYTFISTFTPNNGCDDIVLTCIFTTGESSCDNVPILQCVPVIVGSGSCFEFIITGQLNSEVETFIVTYECNGQIGTWMPGFDPVCCSGDITATALVFFCNCDSVCTPEITCVNSGCTMYSPGNAIMLAVCN